jgi:hypothetical protein
MPGWSWPNGLITIPRVTSEFNPKRLNPVTHIVTAHLGIDLIGFGNNLAVAAGLVTWAQYNGGAGNEVRVKHDDGTETRYKHNARFLVSKGQRVSRGQALGVMGTTGNSTGIHCHFETRYTPLTIAINPRVFMAGRVGSISPAGGGGTTLNPEQDNDMDILTEFQVDDGTGGKMKVNFATWANDVFVHAREASLKASEAIPTLELVRDAKIGGAVYFSVNRQIRYWIQSANTLTDYQAFLQHKGFDTAIKDVVNVEAFGFLMSAPSAGNVTIDVDALAKKILAGLPAGAKAPTAQEIAVAVANEQARRQQE